MYTLGDPGFHLGVLDVEHMFLPKLLASAAVVAAMIPVASAHAAAPWSDPVAVPGSTGQAGAPAGPVHPHARRRDRVQRRRARSPAPRCCAACGAPPGPQPATTWAGAPDFDTGFSAWAAGDRIMYVGPSGRRVKVGIATGPSADWTTTLRGPDTGGARVAAAAAPHAGTAGVFATFEGGGGHVYLVRQLGIHAPSATQRVSGSKKASIRSVAVAMNASGDVLVAWDLHGEIQARLWYGSSKHFGPIQNLAKVTGALHLAVALGNDRRATVAWVDQLVSEGNTGQKATVWATSRSASRGFLLPPKQLEAFPDTAIPGGRSSRPPTRRPGAGSSPGAAATPSARRSSTAARSARRRTSRRSPPRRTTWPTSASRTSWWARTAPPR